MSKNGSFNPPLDPPAFSSYPAYRWVMLILLMLLTIAVQLQWLTHAAIARPASHFHQEELVLRPWLEIDSLAMVYMVIYLVFSLPASWVIARFGLHFGLFSGALLLGVFGLVKGLFGEHLLGVFIAQCGLALAQPFILNCITTLTEQWFPLKERALAAGLSVFAQFVGILLAVAVTPLLVSTSPESPAYGAGIPEAMFLYGWVSAAIALSALLLVREAPLTSHRQSTTITQQSPSSLWPAMKSLLSNRDMRTGLFLFLVGLGLFNAVSALTDAISANLQVKDSNGLLGTLMLIGGMVGAIVFPLVSDHLQKRKAILVICMLGLIPGLAGLAFAGSLGHSESEVFNIALVSSALIGFFILGAGPVGFQYIAEITRPVPEAFSQGAVLLAGQVSGIILVVLMTMDDYQWLGFVLKCSVAVVLVCLGAVLTLKESPAMAEAAQSSSIERE